MTSDELQTMLGAIGRADGTPGRPGVRRYTPIRLQRSRRIPCTLKGTRTPLNSNPLK